jgi:hypothetical protein
VESVYIWDFNFTFRTQVIRRSQFLSIDGFLTITNKKDKERHQLNNSMHRILIHKLIAAELLQKFTSFWKQEFHYHAHKFLLPISVHSQMNPVHIKTILTPILLLFSHLRRLDPLSALFISSLLTEVLYEFLITPRALPAPSISCSLV